MRKFLAVLAAFLMLAAFTYAQKTTGNIKGMVKDKDGKGIPGVTVTITSPALIGQRTAITDENGKFNFPAVPPGVYTIKAELEGFKTAIKKGVRVSLESTAIVNLTMEIGTISETIEVVAKEATVDITSSKVSTNVQKEFFDALPKGRSFQAMVLMAPSVQSGYFGISMGGATGVENLFIVDGINVTDVEHGQGSTNVVYEYIEEVEVKTGGYEAEFEGSLGGVVNIITKSGGNEFHGSALFNYQSDKLYAEPKITVFGGGAIDEFDYYDFGFGLGGYFVKDKIWFFAAATPAFRTTYYNPTNAVTGEVVHGETKSKTYNFSGKLTFLLSQNHTITLSVFGDPRDSKGGNPGTLRDPNSDYKYKSVGGTYNFVAKYEGMFGNDLLASILVGRYWDHTRWLPESEDYDTPVYIYQYGSFGYPHGYRTGGFGWYSDPADKWRWTIKADVTKFWGNHTIKAGFQMYRSISERYDAYTGEFYRVYREPFGYYYDRYRTTKGNSYTDIYALFIQDSWTIGDKLHLNLGLRAESEVLHATDPSLFFEPHEAVISWGFGDMLAPRVGFTYDVFGDATTKIFGSYARYFEIVPMDINTRTFGYEEDVIYFYTLSGQLFYTWVIGHEPPPIQPGIKPPYQEEFILGFEKQLTEDLSLSVRGIYKRLGRIVEDGSFDGGEIYFVFNPGEWEPEDLERPADYARCPEEYLHFPKALRWYKAVEIVLRKRYSNNYQFMLSYTYGRAYGNIPGLAFEEYGQVDPNITAEFDFPELMYNAEGYLPNDRKHQFKFDGTYTFPFGLSLGLSARYTSGKPYTAMGRNEWYGPIAFLDQRGTTGRLPNLFYADLHIAYTYKFADKYRLTLYADIFNITNNREMTQMYTIYDNEHFYGYSDNPSTIMPPWEKPAEPSNPYYGEARSYMTPRRAILGVRFEF